MGEVVTSDRERFANLSRALQDRTAHDHRTAIDRLDDLVDPFDLFRGEPDAREIELETAVIAAPADDATRRLLLACYDTAGRNYLAGLVRGYFDAMPLSPKACEDRISAWRESWREADGVDRAGISGEVDALDVTMRRAIVTWIEHARVDRLVDEPAARPLLILALRSEYAATAARALAELRARDAVAFVWSALARPLSASPEIELAIAHRKLGALAPAQVTEVLTWIGRDVVRTKVAFCLLQDHDDDKRVVEAALRQFVAGSPYTDKLLAERKEAHIDEVLWAAFEREEATVLQDEARIVSYTRAYGVLSRFLARRGHSRAREAHERFQTKLRMDRAKANRIDWEDM
jgi:hypothetical protein